MSGTTTITVSQFLTDFPEFQDSSLYSDNNIQLYLNIYNTAVDPNRWGEYWSLGVELAVAHNLVVDARDLKDANAGKVPGNTISGPVQSKSVGQVSVAYDTQAVSEENAGFWNATSYGRRFIRFAKMAGSGPVQLTGNSPPVFTTLY